MMRLGKDAALHFAPVAGYRAANRRAGQPGRGGVQVYPGTMTALDTYARLETSGLWRADAEAQRMAVGVSFGDATLVIFDNAGRPLSHWSLPAVVRVNPGVVPAIYAPDGGATETLEIDDDLMIAAIDRVQAAVARQVPRPGRVRQVVVAGVLACAAGLAVFWLPHALTGQALSLLPEAKRSEIGATLLGHVQRETGATCRGTVGTLALAELGRRLFGDGARVQIVVVPGDLPQALDLPGGIMVLDRAMVEQAAEPAVTAGFLLAAIAERTSPDPLEPVIAGAGLMGTLRLLTTGDVPGETLEAYAAGLVAAPTILPPVATAVAIFGRAGVPLTPWAEAIDPAGEVTAPLRAADPLAGQAGTPVLGDDDWISLQAICRT
jgi:hypothetical protein